MNKPALFVCIKNPFTRRDLERMGIEALERHFDLRILDCTPWLMPAARRTRSGESLTRANLRAIHSLREFKAALGDDTKGGYAIDYVGQFSPPAVLMFEALRSRGVKLVAMDSGPYPAPEATLGRRSMAAKLLDAFRYGGLRQHLYSRINRLLLAILPDQRADFALVSGTSWQRDPRFAQARRKIEAHSFDYERFRQINTQPAASEFTSAGPYAVYLDEDIAGHEDNEEVGLASPASAQRFYPALARLFDRFESATGMRVLIAAYPSNRPGATAHFGARQVVMGRTAELIRGASLIFAHASTAISFAVLWRRPLIFLTSDEIERSWYQPWIEAPRVLLRAAMMNLDRTPLDVSPASMIADMFAYENYQAEYIKSTRSPERSLWDIFLQVSGGPEIMARP